MKKNDGIIYYVKCKCGGEHRIQSSQEISPLTRLEILCSKSGAWEEGWVMLGIDEEREAPGAQ